MIGANFHPGRRADFFCHRLTRFRIARVWRIAVLEENLLVGNFDQFPLELARVIHIGISQAEIIHIVLAVLLFQDISFLEHFADHGRMRNGCFYFF